MQIIKPEQQKVMSLAMLGKSNAEIATQLDFSLEKVEGILNEPAIKSTIEDVKIASLSNKLEITRLAWANSIIDSIIEWAQRIIEWVTPEKWNKNHVELFKMILREQEKLDKRILDEIQQRINITNNVQINVYSDTQGLEWVLSKIPARGQESFWKDIIALGQKYADEYARTWWDNVKGKEVLEYHPD